MWEVGPQFKKVELTQAFVSSTAEGPLRKIVKGRKIICSQHQKRSRGGISSNFWTQSRSKNMNELSRIEEISFFPIGLLKLAWIALSLSLVGLRWGWDSLFQTGFPADTHAAFVRIQGHRTQGGILPAQQTQKTLHSLGVDTYHRGQKSLTVLKSGGFTKDLYRETSSYRTSLCHAL